MSKELWCIYLAGPDDLVAMPSKAVAEAVARNFNAVWDRYGAERGHDVRVVAHVEPWMHGKDAHTKDLREHFYEYADLVLDEDVARFKPAQPVEAVDEVTDEQIIAACNAAGVRWIPEGEDDFPGMFDLTKMSEMRALFAALAHPRPAGDVPRYTHLPVDLWEAIAKNSVWLMRNARDGHYTLDQAIEYQLGAIATGRDPAPAGEQAGEVNPDPELLAFYGVDGWAGLVEAQQEHVLMLQDAARRNVKPWDDTFPPTLLPKYLRDTGLIDADDVGAYLVTAPSIGYWTAVRKGIAAQSISESHREAGVTDTSIVRLYAAQPRPVGVPEAITNLNECRARGWEDSALAYRSGWNDCRRAALGEEPLGYSGCHELATSVGVKS